MRLQFLSTHLIVVGAFDNYVICLDQTVVQLVVLPRPPWRAIAVAVTGCQASLQNHGTVEPGLPAVAHSVTCVTNLWLYDSCAPGSWAEWGNQIPVHLSPESNVLTTRPPNRFCWNVLTYRLYLFVGCANYPTRAPRRTWPVSGESNYKSWNVTIYLNN